MKNHSNEKIKINRDSSKIIKIIEKDESHKSTYKGVELGA
jgi:hypothetical protein